jgi:ABC-type nitrate/sulfonate/bicarbonate transport system substrate-binding protein
MAEQKRKMLRIVKRRKPLRVGFLPENDCAPLVVAHEFGLFKEYGLEVELQAQASWKHVHDKIIHRYLDASAAPGMLPYLINLGLTPEKRECLSALVLSLQGNAITVSRELWRLGVRDDTSLREQLWKDRGRKVYTFGFTCPLSAQYSLLCQWLKAAKAPPYTEVRLESVPPEQMFPLLKLGYLDGYCAGEPWTSVAVQAGVGACIATSASLAPMHPEKVLMVRKDFAEERAEEHERLIAALVHASYLCDRAENRPVIRDLLAQPRFVNAPSECLEPGLVGPFGPEDDRLRSLHGLNIFHRCGANEPSAAKAAWLTGRLFELLRWRVRPQGIKSVLRPDIFKRARRFLPEDFEPKTEPTQQTGIVSIPKRA